MGVTVSRREALVGAGAVLTAALAGCATEAKAVTVTAPTGSLIMIIRHAEKPTGDGAPYGVTAAGRQDDESLDVRGWTRAGALIGLFDPVSGDVRSGLARPTRIVAANPGHGSKRPWETVTPLAQRLDQHVITTWKKGQESEVARALDGYRGTTLVAWEHKSIAKIVAGLGPVSPRPPSSWPDDRFDLVWTFRRVAGRWDFAQVPQLLLAGDSSRPA